MNSSVVFFNFFMNFYEILFCVNQRDLREIVFCFLPADFADSRRRGFWVFFFVFFVVRVLEICSLEKITVELSVKKVFHSVVKCKIMSH